MKFRLKSWGLFGLSILAGAFGCSGKTFHNVGRLTEAGASANGGRGGGGSSGGSGGSGGAGRQNGGGAGLENGGRDIGGDPTGGSPDVLTKLSCPTCENLAAGNEIAGIAATADTVFWVEHGSYDDLGNYQNDGRLLSVPVAGGATTLLAQGLEGPVELALTPHYIYVLLGNSAAGHGRTELVRFALGSDAAEELHTLADHRIAVSTRGDWFTRQFTASDSAAVWEDDTTVYRVAETPGAEPQALLEAEEFVQIMGDESFVYVADSSGISTFPWLGGERVPLPRQTLGENGRLFGAFSLSGDFIYAVEAADPHPEGSSGYYLSQLPKTGGVWKRLLPLEDGDVARAALSGSHFVMDVPEPPHQFRRLLQGNLGSGASLVPVARAPQIPLRTWRPNGVAWLTWSISSAGIFFADGDVIYRAPFKD